MTVTTTGGQVPVCIVGDDGGYVYDTSVRVLFAEEIADIQNVTREEIDYAVDTTDIYCLVGIRGWEVTSDIITDPPWGLFNSQRLGSLRMQSPVNTLTYAADRLGADIREIFTRGVRGWVLFLPSGDVPGAPMQVFPVWVAAVTPLQRLRNNGAQIEVLHAVTSRPNITATVPGMIET